MNFFKNLYFDSRFFVVFALLVFLFILGYFSALLLVIAKVSFIAFMVALALDFIVMYRRKKPVFARRETPEKLSNGDQNELKIFIENFYNFPVKITVVDEIPFQFQVRDFKHCIHVPAGGSQAINYFLRPVKRGEYSFGALNIFTCGPIGFVKRRFVFDQGKVVPVYPSFIQMNKYELLAISNSLKEGGIKMLRKIGHSLEFEKIREYVNGDDYRSINWKATARKSEFMVNQFQDEKSQQVFCVIDKGRTMQTPFEGLSLLDYAINASLVISNIALNKQDKAGLITFADKLGVMLPADKKRLQLKHIMEILYNQKTKYLESDFEKLYVQVQRKIHHRALLFLFTNFGSLSSLYRQLPYLKKMARRHLLVVVFFENTELLELLGQSPRSTEEIYIKTIAEQFVYEKKQMVKELEAAGIHSILTTPAHLTINSINKYLELKSRRLI